MGNVFYIGLLSFFGGISQDIFVSILPLYLSNVLGLDKTFIGLSAGLVTSGASVFKIVAGFLTDKFGKKKPFIFLGYLFSLSARPLLAFTTAGAAVLGLRFMDGIGKGMKDSPKDALIADSTEVGSRGRGFGIARMLDTLGSVVGSLVLFTLLYFLKDSSAKAFVADMVPVDHRGRAYGIYNTAIGVVTLPASFIAGLLWDHFNPSTPFLFGALISVIALVLLVIFSVRVPKNKPAHEQLVL